MTTLLDANVLIALAAPGHEHHQPAHAWLVGVEKFAICPITEGALVRYLLREGKSGNEIRSLLNLIQAMADCEFWADDLSYQEIDLTHLLGPRQATDAYLVALAKAHGGRLATFDRPLARLFPMDTELIPTSSTNPA